MVIGNIINLSLSIINILHSGLDNFSVEVAKSYLVTRGPFNANFFPLFRRLAVKELLEMPSPRTRRKGLDHDENLPPLGGKRTQSPSASSAENEEVKPVKSLLRPTNL